MTLTKHTVAIALVLLAGAAMLAQQAPPPANQGAATQAPPGRGRGAAGGGGGFANSFPQHAAPDPQAVERGKQLFGVNCSFCHGSDARGGEGGPNLLRSQLVLNDQNGEAVAVVVQNGRVDKGMPKFDLTTAQVSDIAAFLHSFRVAGYDESRNTPPSILVGDAKAGETYFNGAGKCSTCHSATGDLAGIGGKMEPKALQNALVSGRPAQGGDSGDAKITVTVTLPSGKVAEGKLDHLDDFVVALTDAAGNHLSFRRNGDIPRVEVHNPLRAHIDMLPKYTDDDIHNLTAYLVTLR